MAAEQTKKNTTAKLRYLRMAPRKMRLVANVLRGLSVNEAEAQLLINPKRATEPLLKLLRSAVANAKNNSKLDANKLVIKEIRVDGGPMLKRWLPRAQGRATPIQKKSSHISIVLAESEKIKVPKYTITKVEKISKSKAAKLRKEQERDAHEHEHHEHKEQEVMERETKQAPKKGFAQRIFRRKSI